MACQLVRILAVMSLSCSVIALAASAQQAPAKKTITLKEAQADLAARRKRLRAWHVEQATKETAGWECTESKGLVLNLPAEIKNSRAVTHVTDLLRNVHKWLVAHPAKTWKKKPRPPMLLRMGETLSEDFTGGVRDHYSDERQETVCTIGRGSGLRWTFSRAGVGYTVQYLDMRLPGLWHGLPEWVVHGLREHLQTAAMTKRYGFIFRRPTRPWLEATRMDPATIPGVWELTRKPAHELAAEKRLGPGAVRVLQQMLVRHLTEGPGRKGRTKGLLSRYVDAVARRWLALDEEAWRTVLEEIENDPARSGPLARDEAFVEFESRMRAARAGNAKTREAVFEEAWQEVFGTWTAKEWNPVQKSFVAYLRKGPK